MDTVSSNLNVSCLALAQVCIGHPFRVWFVRALVAEGASLSAVADTLEPSFGEAGPALASVVVPNGVSDDTAPSLSQGFTGISSIEGTFWTDTTFRRNPDFRSRAIDAGGSCADLASRTHTSQINCIPQESISARNIRQASLLAVVPISAIGAESSRSASTTIPYQG